MARLALRRVPFFAGFVAGRINDQARAAKVVADRVEQPVFLRVRAAGDAHRDALGAGVVVPRPLSHRKNHRRSVIGRGRGFPHLAGRRLRRRVRCLRFYRRRAWRTGLRRSAGWSGRRIGWAQLRGRDYFLVLRRRGPGKVNRRGVLIIRKFESKRVFHTGRQRDGAALLDLVVIRMIDEFLSVHPQPDHIVFRRTEGVGLG